jgi:hypothetical protein
MSPHPHLRVWSCATNTTTFIGFLEAKFETLNVGIDKQNDDLNIQCYFFFLFLQGEGKDGHRSEWYKDMHHRIHQQPDAEGDFGEYETKDTAHRLQM